jgi:hypothetical protein
MSQPSWQSIAQLGDVNPIDHGGYFIYRDITGVYPEEGEILEPPPEDSEDGQFTIYRFSLDRCKVVWDDNPFAVYLVPDGYNPENWQHALMSYDEWFHDDLASVAESEGSTLAHLREEFCSPDPLARARAYESIGRYHGWENLDSYPLTLSREEVEKRYAGDK